MTAFGKRIIPLQRKDHTLAFNVRSLDTIRYDNFSLRRVLEQVALDIVEEVSSESQKSISTGVPIRALSLFMELQGYGKTGTQVVHGTPFKHFAKPGGAGNKYCCVIRNEGDILYLRRNLALIARADSIYKCTI